MRGCGQRAIGQELGRSTGNDIGLVHAPLIHERSCGNLGMFFKELSHWLTSHDRSMWKQLSKDDMQAPNSLWGGLMFARE